MWGLEAAVIADSRRVVCSRGTAAMVLALSWGILASPWAAAGISETVFSIQASNQSGSGSVVAAFSEGEWDPATDEFTWTLPEQVDILDDVSGEFVASLLNAEIFIRATQDCEIDATVGVVSGDSETTFLIQSALVEIEPVPGWTAQARATGSFTVTHLGGPYAYLRGLGPSGTGAFRSYYNGYLAEGTRFAHLVASVYVDGGGTVTGSQADPSSGYRSIGEEIYNVSTEIAFTLTAGDLAFATTASGMAEPEECVGDVSGDGYVDMDDLGQLLGAYGTSSGEPGFDPDADIYEDGAINLSDLGELLPHYGESCW